MRLVNKIRTSPRLRILLNVAFASGLLAVTALSAEHFADIGWPLRHADPVLVGGSAVLFLLGYAFKAWGWQRLFPEHERPAAGALAFAGGAACVGGVALPGRIDDALRIAVVKRYPGNRTGLGVLGLSLIVLGMLDNAALTPLASVAAADSKSWAVRVGFAVVAAAGVGAALVVAFLPKLARWRHVKRFRIGTWLGEHTHCTKEAWAAWILVSVSWALRGTAVFLLLNSLALGVSFPLALAFLCASAASAALPIAPAGAATQAGAGAAILIASGVSTPDAIAFSVAVQAMVVVTGAAVVLLVSAAHLATRVAPLVGLRARASGSS
ncbi:MAG TPA: lysylphosphatidylglycerol synthase domain-containing protein [Gaiellaceae bacterium]